MDQSISKCQNKVPLVSNQIKCRPNLVISSSRMFLHPLVLLLIAQILACSVSPNENYQAQALVHFEPIDDNLPRLVRINYNDGLMKDRELQMIMGQTRRLNLTVKIDKVLLMKELAAVTYVPDFIGLFFISKTFQPQFEILKLSPEILLLSRKHLDQFNYSTNVSLEVHADYLGRGHMQPTELLLSNNSEAIQSYNQSTIVKDIIMKPLQSDTDLLKIVVIQPKNFWDTLFIVTVSLLVIIIYLNLGSQIDLGNMRQIIHRPRSIFLGFAISTLTMPLVAFLVPKLFETRHFLLTRVGFFMFACGPAALASTPWAELMGGDKELSMSLQLLSTVGGFVVMPTLIYIMELALGTDDIALNRLNPLQVPYSRLFELLIILIVSLSIGYYFIGRNPRLRKITARIYRPLIFAMLLFIIISSSIIYWHIYRMFDWEITLTAFTIIVISVLLSYMLALAGTCDTKHALTIAISSIYKNEGIAFTILAFAFDKPDNFVAYVPCLTQILITSLSFCLIRTFIQVGKVCRNRRSGGDEPTATPELIAPPSQQRHERAGGCCAAMERDQFIPVNVTDEDENQISGDHSDASIEPKVQVTKATSPENSDDKTVC